MRQNARQTIRTDKRPARAGVQLRPLFVGHYGPHCSHPLERPTLHKLGSHCQNAQVCRELSIAVVRYPPVMSPDDRDQWYSGGKQAQA